MDRINRISFCCYEVEGNAEDYEQVDQVKTGNQQDTVPMLSMGMNSKIKFSNINKKNDQPIYQLLLQLYQNRQVQGQSDRIFNILSKKRINPNFNWVQESSGERDDLQYYIPQLITYLVIEQNLDNVNLIQIILEACTTDFYFAHSVYFYLNSFTQNWMNEPIKGVMDFIEKKFLPNMGIYSKNRLSGIQFTRGMIHNDPQFKQFCFNQKMASSEQINKIEQIKIYGTTTYPNPCPDYPATVEAEYIEKKMYNDNGFMETPMFWNDLITIGQDISSVLPTQRNQVLDHMIKTRVNVKLPASVYIPFFKDKLRMYTVLCVWKGRIFSTKERAPFSIWVQLYRQQEELSLIEDAVPEQFSPIKAPKNKKQKIMDKIVQTLSKPFNISENKNTLNIKKYFKDKFSSSIEQQKQKTQLKESRKKYSSSFFEAPISKLDKEERRKLSLSFFYQNQDSQGLNSNRGSSGSSNERGSKERIFQGDVYNEHVQQEQHYFPPKSTQQIQQFKKKSIYRNLKSWKIKHLMVKTGDDLKQEQFAMQLINNFDGIFKKQKIDCAVFPYEVISLGPNYGLIEMLQDVTTFDGLFKILGPKKVSLKQFFNTYYADNIVVAKRNFMRSLAGYCLITYFLQVKDRHNGNILLHRDGYIIHIDFGFFLSNSPGKGVQLQKNVPFKLLTQYVEVIGSLSSENFFQFRRLFYKGFAAIVKHRSSIISLVKMMYSSHGQSMGCFIKSQEAVYALQKRLNPPQNLEQFCYDLINASLDNWRSKWYDKFQYFLQKIYY